MEENQEKELLKSIFDELTDQQKPHATNPVHNGSAQALVTAPKSLPDGYVGVQYSTDGGKNWSDTLPKATNTGEYTAPEEGGTGEIVISLGETALHIPVTVVADVFRHSFEDMGGHAWADDAVSRLVEAGVVSGTSPTAFSPEKNITRADFMLLLVRMMQLDPSIGAGEQFVDVAPDAYYASALSAAKALGIAQGSASGEFFPTRSITREEMFTLIYRVMQKMGALSDDAPSSALSGFSDATEIADYAKTPIATLTQSGLIAGSGGKVNPKSNTTRAEAAVMIDRVRTATGGEPL